MPKENSKENQELVKRLEQIKELLDEAIAFIKNDPKVSTLARASAPDDLAKTSENIDFSMPIRPFVKKYCGSMSGPEKFTLLLAFLSSGDTSKKISLDEIKKQWNKMTGKGLLGMSFNSFYSSKAKENDWADSEETGQYHLRPSWKEIFNAKN